MRISDAVVCHDFPCLDVQHQGYIVPDIEIDTARVEIVVISEAAPQQMSDFYYASGSPHFVQTTVTAFRDAGYRVETIEQILDMGVYLTTAVKCAKTDYGIKAGTIQTCSHLLEKELDLFPNVKAYLLMGDVAIKSVNAIAKRCGEGKVIPAGSTYKIRGAEYYFRGGRAFPSYLQVGPSFGIEKSKRSMISEDIQAAVESIIH